MGLTRLQPGSCCGCATPFTTCANCNLTTTYPTLYVTDSYTTIPILSSGTTWYGCYELPLAANCVDSCACAWPSATPTPGAGTVSILYQVSCGSGATLDITRYWYYCSRSDGCWYCSCSVHSPPPVPCTLQACGGAYTGTCPQSPLLTPQCTLDIPDTGSVTLSSCTPFPLSATLALGSAPCVSPYTLSSPLGSGITINT